MSRVFGLLAPCPTLAGCHDHADVICLTRLPVNNPTSAMQSACGVRAGRCHKKGRDTVGQTPQYRNWCAHYAFFEGKKAEETATRKSTSRTSKEVGQQSREGLRDMTKGLRIPCVRRLSLLLGVVWLATRPSSSELLKAHLNDFLYQRSPG
jgi:hypothetical protein